MIEKPRKEINLLKNKKWIMQIIVGIWSVAVAPQAQANSEVNNNLAETPLMKKHTSIQCRYEKNKNIRFFKHRKGFTAYTLDPGNYIVLMISVEELFENTSIRFARELVFDLRDIPPLSELLSASSWVTQALYKFGGPDLQFESQEFSGTIEITDMQDNGDCHGLVNLTFSNPTIDRSGVGQSDLNISF